MVMVIVSLPGEITGCGASTHSSAPSASRQPLSFNSVRESRLQEERDPMKDCGRDAKNSTTQTHSKTMSLNMNSPVRFHAIGSVDTLHETTPGVVKKNDQVMTNVTMPMSEPIADTIGLNAPTARSAAMPSSTTPRT